MGRFSNGAGLALLATRTIVAGRRWEKPTIVGLLMCVGVSVQILLPNAYMPDGVRYGHFPELFVENFIFGVIAALLFTRVTSKEIGTKVD